jgi:hypothetical protein
MIWSSLRLPDRLGRYNGSLWEVLFSVERALMVLALLRFHSADSTGAGSGTTTDHYSVGTS